MAAWLLRTSPCSCAALHQCFSHWMSGTVVQEGGLRSTGGGGAGGGEGDSEGLVCSVGPRGAAWEVALVFARCLTQLHL